MNGTKLGALESELKLLQVAVADKDTRPHLRAPHNQEDFETPHPGAAQGCGKHNELEFDKKMVLATTFFGTKGGLKEELRTVFLSDKEVLAESFAKKNELKALAMALQ